MLTFWIIIAIMVLMALVFVIPVFLKKEIKESDVDHNSLNVAIYKEQKAELEREDLTPEQRLVAQQELDKNLAQNLDNAFKMATQARARWASVIVIIAIPVFAGGMYWKLGNWNLIAQEKSEQTTASSPHGTNEQAPKSDFDQLVTNLAARLENEPNNQQGWQMLARSYMVMERYPEAVKAYNKLLSLVGENDPQLLSDLAQATALANDGQFAGQPLILLKTALEADPNHQQSLWLIGLASVEKQDYQAAINYWENLKNQLSGPKDAEMLKVLNNHITNARNQLGEEIPSEITEPKQLSETSEGTIIGRIEVQVELAESLREQVNPDDTLFIYAKATQGPPMPLAIVKKLASELPIQVVLDDSMAMMPTMKLSNFKEVTVMARISRSGQATTQSGDLIGQVSPVTLGKQNQVNVKIRAVQY